MGPDRFFVYILASRSRVLYTGVTRDLLRRVYQHRKSEIPGFTRRYQVNRLVYFEETSSARSAASQRAARRDLRRYRGARGNQPPRACGKCVVSRQLEAAPSAMKIESDYENAELLVALANVIGEDVFVKRFHTDPRVQATELLLQERVPHQVPLKNPPIEKAEHVPSAPRMPALLIRRYVTDPISDLGQQLTDLRSCGASQAQNNKGSRNQNFRLS